MKKILVIGGGIGGLTASIALRRKGFDVDLVEINSVWTVYHVGIIVQANVIRALKEIGLADAAVKVGYPYSGFEMQDAEGHTLMRAYGPPLAGDDYPTDLGMGRPALHEILTQGARENGVNINIGVSFAKIEDQGDQVLVRFTDDRTERYDLVIGADGAYSKVREQFFPTADRPRFTGQGVWRYNLPRPADMTHTVMMDGVPGGKAGYVPLTESTMYILYVGMEPGNPWFEKGTLADEFRKRLAPYGGRIPEFAPLITDSDQVVYRPLEVTLVKRPWHVGRVVLIGDAAHATTPHLGQGAAQAIEDAVVLAEEVAAGGPIEDVLNRFEDRRYERVRFIWESSIQVGEWEQRPVEGADAAGMMALAMEHMSAPL